MPAKTRKPFFERLKTGLEEGIAHARGELTLRTIDVPEAPPEIDAINYHYVDKAGQEQSGDLLQEAFASKEHLLGAVKVGPGAGSTNKPAAAESTK